MMAEQLSLEDALRARERAQRRVMLGAGPDYRDAVWNAICELAATGAAFSADDVRNKAGEAPEGSSPNLVGALFTVAAKSGLIRACGFHRSARVIGHGNRILLWRSVA